MRTLLVALVLLTAPLAGCLDFGNPNPVLSSPPPLPNGLVLTYEIEDTNSSALQELILFRHVAPRGYDLYPYNVTGDLESPFLKLAIHLSPRTPRWAGLVSFPLEAGTSYDAVAGTEQVTVEVTYLSAAPAPFQDRPAYELVASSEEGDQRARLVVLTDPVVLAVIEVDTVDGTQETWELQEIVHRPDWNQKPAWRLGDWWSFEGSWAGQSATPTMIYTQNRTTSGGTPQAIWEAAVWTDREPSRPLSVWSLGSLQPASGSLANHLPNLWDWALAEDKTVTGATLAGGENVGYAAQPRFEESLELPDGSRSVGFSFEARTASDDEPFATWNYVPRVGLFTSFHLEDPDTGEPIMAWTLTDWGREYHGPFEDAHREQLLNQPVVSGPTAYNKSFQVDEPIRMVEVFGFAARGPEPENNSSISLAAPDGASAWSHDPEDFQADRRSSLRAFVEATPGTWELRAQLQQDTSFFANIFGHWSEEVILDCRGPRCEVEPASS